MSNKNRPKHTIMPHEGHAFNIQGFGEEKQKWLLSQMSPVTQLTRENLPLLANHHYMVGPKADGTRSLLLCESNTSHFYLLSHSAPPRRLEGSYMGPEHKGFLLDVEVVSLCSDTRLIVAFDVCCLGTRMKILDTPTAVTFVKQQTFSYGRYYTVASLADRRNLLRSLVRSISIPHLVVKPIAPANQAETCYGAWRNLPYRTDGLVFTPCSNADTLPVLKWKPTEELTLDVALGAAVEQDSSDCRFVTYLYQGNYGFSSIGPRDKGVPGNVVAPDHHDFYVAKSRLPAVYHSMHDDDSDYDYDCNNDEYDITRTHAEDVKRITAEQEKEREHWCMETNRCTSGECPCGEVVSTSRKGSRTWHSWGRRVDKYNITLIQVKDAKRIATERKKECEHWCLGKDQCTSDDCPCGEVASEKGNRIWHCFECGALGVGETSFTCRLEHVSQETPRIVSEREKECQELYAETSPDTHNRILHCSKCGALGVGDDEFTCRLHAKSPCCVWVPKEDAEWARHAVVEVEIVSEPFDLRFKRVRFDKSKANSFDVANNILQLHRCPIELSSIQFKETKDLSISQVPTTTLSTRDARCQRSAFRNLRQHHHAIKEWLYQVFGGHNVIDACAGSLHDMDSWIRAGFANVLAVEKDEDLYLKGLSTIQKLGEGHSTKVTLLKGDLSSPIDLSKEMLSEPLDAIFCNFAIHYFWHTSKATTDFLRNLCPFLRDGGRFVVTFLQGEVMRRMGSIEIKNNDNVVEFSAKILDTGCSSVNVYVASIGKPHNESVIELSELRKRFGEAGFDMVSHFPFETIGGFAPISKGTLTEREAEMSNLYAAAVFEKRCRLSAPPSDPSLSLFGQELPPGIQGEILDFLSIPDLVKCRLLSQTWRREVEHISTSTHEKTKSSFFARFAQDSPIRYNRYTHTYVYKGDTTLSPASVGLYVRLGGPPIQIVEDEIILNRITSNVVMDYSDAPDYHDYAPDYCDWERDYYGYPKRYRPYPGWY